MRKSIRPNLASDCCTKFSTCGIRRQPPFSLVRTCLDPPPHPLSNSTHLLLAADVTHDRVHDVLGVAVADRSAKLATDLLRRRLQPLHVPIHRRPVRYRLPHCLCRSWAHRAAMTTEQPSDASSCAMHLPMPVPPPVTTACSTSRHRCESGTRGHLLVSVARAPLGQRRAPGGRCSERTRRGSLLLSWRTK